ncbi:MAG: SDR family oxidoreductase [Candidatus Omnitrophica bacterium]|nr:SDR family oxidoreductase [Candidatus Omnitrophota bacterium]MDD5166477.1 SDR family oxidoreductase [Candidatus Omnitrophota bacterium]
MNKRVTVVTGGAGFLGSHLCDKLVKEGFKVICLDNFITGNLKNIRHLLGSNNFRFIEHNVSKYIDIGEPVDYVLHFASPASPVDYMKFPIQTLKVGSLGTHNALGLALKKKAIFMLASTSEVYGDPLVHPQPEDYWGNVNPIGLRGCYDESKRFAEALTMAYHRVHKIDIRIIRIFNTYGPRMRIDDGRVIPNFIYQLLNNQPLTVYGKGKQTRSFCYISDLIEGIYKLMLKPVNEPVNLGNPNEFTVLELAKIMLKLNGTKSKIVFKPLPEDDPRQRQPDIRKAKKIINWKPKVELKEGLLKTVEWFRDNSGSH